jgi:enoyl-CoA hydratase
MATYATLIVERRDDGIAVITINRPDKLNALNAAVIAELDGALADLDADPAVRALVVTGSGEKAFVAGADIAELAQATPIEARALALKGQRVFDRLERFRGPVIAAVNGFALGGGCELALACHLRIATPGSRFGTPEVKLGLICGYAGTQRLPRLIGRGRALEILLSGEMVLAEEAFRIGLVNRVVAPDALMNETVGLLKKMLANAPLSLRYTIDSVNAGLDMSFEDAQDHEATLFAVLCSTADKTEGTSAFLEKRPAKFQGR